MLKTIGRTRIVQETVAHLAVTYLRLVRATNRFIQEPADFTSRITPDLPIIVAMWHGQHFMAHYAWPRGGPGGNPVSALISRHEDGEINAIILRRLGVIPIRGSGGTQAKIRKRGGVPALREMVRTLARGTTIVMTADVPKVSRRAGRGIIALAQLSGRPIYPLAVVTKRRFDFKTWDRASIGKPFGRGAMVLGTPIRVPAQAREWELEGARRTLETGLDAVHARAYALVGCEDPGCNGAGIRDRSKADAGGPGAAESSPR